MIGTEFIRGQGLGNRLFCYVTARAVAARRGVPFGCAGTENLNAPFMELDTGEAVPHPEQMNHYQEADRRIYLPTCPHDMIHGCDIRGADPGVLTVPDNTLLYGNLQAESYFQDYHDEIVRWLRIKAGYDSSEYTQDDLCILNVRGGEYEGNPALFLCKKYWLDAMEIMRRQVNPKMRFLVVTDDEENAKRMLPGLEVHHFSPEKDYVTIRNARYLILSNTSFAFFPAYTSETVRRIIAPQYWARHNVSDGYWSSEQNIYDEFEYLGRDGKVRTAQQCREELSHYHYPDQSSPWCEDDPAVGRVRKRCEQQRLRIRAAWKISRMLHR